MNSDQFQGQWQQMKGSIKQHWAKLTDDDVTYIDGALDRFLGRLQERYGVHREEADRLVKKWLGDRPA